MAHDADGSQPFDERPVFSRHWWSLVAQTMAAEFVDAVRDARSAARGPDGALNPHPDPHEPYLPLRVWVGGLALLAIVAGVFGMVDDTPGFAGNLVAELVGVGIGLALSVGVIDQLLKRQRYQEWSAVASRLTASIANRVVTVGVEFHQSALTSYSGSLLAVAGDRDEPRDEVRTALLALRVHLQSETRQLVQHRDLDRASSRTLYRAVSPHLGDLRDSITPKVIAVTRDASLVEELLELEHAEAAWRAEIDQVERSQAPESSAWAKALATLGAATSLYTYLAVSR